MRFFFLLTLLYSFSLMANTQVKTQIHDIDMGSQGMEEPLIFLTSGQVVKFKIVDKKLLTELQEAVRNKTWYEITINDQREIVNLEVIPTPEVTAESRKMFSLQSIPFEPSILKSLDVARTYFFDARTNPKESQCFNRAHVWSYDWRVKHKLYSSKVWLYFTRKFIRKYKFQWWFHVAPMVHVLVNGEVKERIMDVKYARGPIKLKTWTDIFLRDYAECPVVDKYSDQANHPESGSCFIMKSSMYYYQPVDLEQKELTGVDKSSWLEPEVRQAFLEAMEVTL
jgi:hypothetical protein